MTHLAIDPSTAEPYIPTKQRSAREQQAMGVIVPYFQADLDGPINWNLTLVVLSPDKLEKLAIYCRKKAADVVPNPLDNRTNLDYPPTDRELVNVLRHSGLNRTEKNAHAMNGYSGSYDAIMYRIKKKGIDVENRQMNFKAAVLRLIAATYPYLALECEEQIFHTLKGKNDDTQE